VSPGPKVGSVEASVTPRVSRPRVQHGESGGHRQLNCRCRPTTPALKPRNRQGRKLPPAMQASAFTPREVTLWHADQVTAGCEQDIDPLCSCLRTECPAERRRQRRVERRPERECGGKHRCRPTARRAARRPAAAVRYRVALPTEDSPRRGPRVPRGWDNHHGRTTVSRPWSAPRPAPVRSALSSHRCSRS